MIRLAWSLGVSIHGFLRYAPTNLLLNAFRTPRRLKWAPLLMLLAPVYLFASGFFYTLWEMDGPTWLSFLGLLMFWNCIKFAWVGPISLLLLARNAVRRRAQRARENRAARASARRELTLAG